MIYIESKSFNPYFNLALEQYVFDNMDRSQEYFLLWQNDNTIVVGKHQNTIGEINQEFVQDNNISVVRRLSGGGAVYHDRGNLNFTIIVSQTNKQEDFEFGRFCQVVVAALSQLGVKAELNGRNDITIDGKKFSGNSQYMKQGRIMHHGCILYDADLTKLSKALKVSKDKIESKGIKSVVSRVTNVLATMSHKYSLEEFKAALVEQMSLTGEMLRHELTAEELKAIERLQKERYETWEWNYGASPAYDLVKERYIPNCGKIEVHMNVKNGVICDFDIYGDYFGNGDKKELAEILRGKKINQPSLEAALKDVDLNKYLHNMDTQAFIALLLA